MCKFFKKSQKSGLETKNSVTFLAYVRSSHYICKSTEKDNDYG